MVKIAHFADTHLGYKQYGLYERENDFYKAFEKITDDMIEKDVDYVIHSGDLFEQAKPPINALLTAQQGFEKLIQYGIEVFVIAGNHDVIQRSKTAIPQRLYESDKFHILDTHNTHHIINDEIFIGGIQYTTRNLKEKVGEYLNKIAEYAIGYPYKILMLHGSVDKYFDFEAELPVDVIPEGFDYYALGHIHERKIDSFKNGILSYPGSTEFRSKSEIKDYNTNKKGYNLLTLEDNKIDVEYVDMPLRRKFLSYTINYFELDEKLDNIKNKIQDEANKPVLFITVENGNFERSEVSQKVQEKLGEYSLTIKPNYNPTDITEDVKEVSSDKLRPEYLIREQLNSTYETEEISEYGVLLYQKLSNSDNEDALKITQDLYENLFNKNE